MGMREAIGIVTYFGAFRLGFKRFLAQEPQEAAPIDGLTGDKSGRFPALSLQNPRLRIVTYW
jgi:hypothetical protein